MHTTCDVRRYNVRLNDPQDGEVVMTKKRILATVAAVVGLTVASLVPATAASAASYCDAQHGVHSSYVQHDYSYRGRVVATLCSYANTAHGGYVYFHARGAYAGIEKKMTLSVRTLWSPREKTVSGRYRYYVYTWVPAGLHAFNTVMWNGSGTRIVKETRLDHD